MTSTRPTVLQIVPRLDTGGAELSTVEIAEALVAAGARALVATAGGRLCADIWAAGGEIVDLPADSKNPLTMAANISRLQRLIADAGVDLVHARSRAPAWSALAAARRARVPFVTTYHGAYGERGRVKRLYNSVMARGDVVIANSAFTADLVRSRYGTPSERIVVIHRGVDAARFDPARVPPERVAAMRASWGVPPQTAVLLQVARLTGWKGQTVLIDAAGRLAAREGLADWAVVLAGDDQGRTGYREGLLARAEALGLADRLRVVGHVEDVPAAMAAAHVAVVASIEPEAFGRAATEAQAMGCPVIATDIGVPPETVRAFDRAAPGTQTGWLVPPGRPDALAEALVSALTMPAAERRALGERARAHVMAHFTLAHMKRATLGVYDRLLGTALAARLPAVGAADVGATQRAATL